MDGEGTHNIMKLKAKAILFDLDGTIVDSREAYLEAARVAFQTLNLEMPELGTVLEIPKRLEQKLPVDDIIKGNAKRFLDVYLKTYYSNTEEKTKPFPKAQIALAKLFEKAKLAITTMRFVSKDQIASELEQFSLAQYFGCIITALDTHKPKPSPEALVKAVKTLEVDLCDCIIVGDSVVDVRAGKAAGALTVSVLSGLFSYEDLTREQPDLIIDDVTLLPGYVDRVD